MKDSCNVVSSSSGIFWRLSIRFLGGNGPCLRYILKIEYCFQDRVWTNSQAVCVSQGLCRFTNNRWNPLGHIHKKESKLMCSVPKHWARLMDLVWSCSDILPSVRPHQILGHLHLELCGLSTWFARVTLVLAQDMAHRLYAGTICWMNQDQESTGRDYHRKVQGESSSGTLCGITLLGIGNKSYSSSCPHLHSGLYLQ